MRYKLKKKHVIVEINVKNENKSYTETLTIRLLTVKHFLHDLEYFAVNQIEF